MPPTLTLSIAELVPEIRRALRPDGEGEPAARRLAFGFVEAVDRADPTARQAMVSASPDTTGDVRYDALVAALVEHVCVRWALPVPAWVEDPDRFLGTWWFVSGLRSLHALALVQSPISFARRGVFILDGALEYA